MDRMRYFNWIYFISVVCLFFAGSDVITSLRHYGTPGKEIFSGEWSVFIFNDLPFLPEEDIAGIRSRKV